MFQSTIINHLLNGLDPIHNKTIKLKNGQIFQGTILKIYPGNMAQMRLGGLTLTAKLEANIEKGKRYWFRVVGGDGLPTLKVLKNLPPLPMNKDHQLGRDDSRQLQKISQQLKLPNTPLMKEMMQRFIQEDVPFTRNILLQGSHIIEQSPLYTRDGISLFIHMLKRHIPITKETFMSISSLFSNESLSESLPKLYTFLLQSNGREKYPTLVATLKNIIQFQMNHDHHPLSLPLKTEGDSSINRLANVPILRQFLELFGFQHEFDVRKSFQQQNNIASFQTLKAQLLAFLASAKSKDFVQARKQAQFIVNRITAMQLLSLETQQPLQQIVMQFPIFMTNSQHDVTIQWEGKEGKNGQIDEDHCRILFYLHLKRLEETVVDVQIQNRVITVSVYNDHDRPTKLINMWIEPLKEKLSEMNYHLSTVKWIKTSEEKPSRKEGKHPHRLFCEDVSYQGVDVRI